MNCATCKFFRRYDPERSLMGKVKPSDSGACYRYPPVPVGAGSMAAASTYGYSQSCHPEVHEADFCGEYQS